MEAAVTSLIGPVYEELIQLIGSFRSDAFNARASDGGWTAGQIAEHLRLSVRNFSSLLNGTTQPTERDPEANVEVVRHLFMDFDNRMQAPGFLLPEDKAYDRNEFMTFFRNFSETLQSDIENLDMNATCLDFQLPGFGFFTRVEWVAFVCYHTQRHIHQMRKLARQV